MEKKIKKLFDYQRFEKNEKLEKLIRDTENRYATELSDDDLSFVSAAGENTPPEPLTDGNKDKVGRVGQTSTTFS